jgi:hypothetical protein
MSVKKMSVEYISNMIDVQYANKNSTSEAIVRISYPD